MNQTAFFNKFIVTFALGLFCSITFANEALWRLVWSTHDQARSLSYSGLLVRQSGPHVQSSRLLHFATDNGEFETLERLEGQPAKWIRHNDQIQCVLPDRKLILTEQRKTSNTFPRVFTAPDGSVMLDELYSIQEMPSERIADRLTRTLKLVPKDELRYEYRLYIDKKSNLLLRSELYSPKGVLLEQVGFKEILFNPDVSTKPNLFDWAPGWKISNTEVSYLKDEELPYTLPVKVSGFIKTDTFCRIKEKNTQVYQTVYSDGLSTVSVFINRQQSDFSMPKVPMSQGAVMSKSQVQGKYLVTVLGEVPEKTLEAFLSSVQWKSQ